MKYKYGTKEVKSKSKNKKIGVPWMERNMFTGAVSQKSLGTTGLHLPPSTCSWIKDFLSNRPQHVRFGPNLSPLTLMMCFQQPATEHNI